MANRPSHFRFYPTDPPHLVKQVRRLEELGFQPDRMTEHQIKIGDYNWYWNRGTITKDPCHRLTEKGFEALVQVLTPKSSSAEIKIKLGRDE